MSLFSRKDYEAEHKQTNKVKNFTRSNYHGGIATTTKIRLPSQYRTIKHQCSHCIRTDATKHKISTKEVRWLCPNCIIKYNNKNLVEKPNFLPASKLWRKKQ